MDKKEDFERRQIEHTPIIITTCNGCLDRRLRGKQFKKVIIDEAAQASEIETLIPILNAK